MDQKNKSRRPPKRSKNNLAEKEEEVDNSKEESSAWSKEFARQCRTQNATGDNNVPSLDFSSFITDTIITFEEKEELPEELTYAKADSNNDIRVQDEENLDTNFSRAISAYWEIEFERRDMLENDEEDESGELRDEDEALKKKAVRSEQIFDGTGDVIQKGSRLDQVSQNSTTTSKQFLMAEILRANNQVTSYGLTGSEKRPRRDQSSQAGAHSQPPCSNNQDSLELELQREKSQPGAYAEAGPGAITNVEQVDSTLNDDDSEVGEPEQRRPCSNFSESPHDIEDSSTSLENKSPCSSVIVKAQTVNDAEPIFYAQDVRRDRFKRNLAWGVLFSVVFITVVIVPIKLMKAPPACSNDPLCCKPINEQNSFDRCFCSNFTSTHGLYDELSKLGKEIYDSQMDRLETIQLLLGANETIDVDSCSYLNQMVLNVAQDEAWGLSIEELQDGIPDDVYWSIMVLLYTYASMDGIHWNQDDNWLNDPVPCDWYGVGCLFVDVFDQLTLANNGLSGTIAPIYHLTEDLRLLDLSGNRGITGTIPTELGQVSTLQSLRLGDLSLSGTIPKEIGDLTRLGILSLLDNSLTGTLPPDLFLLSELRELNLGNNSFTGTLPEIGQPESRLSLLILNHNQLSGTLPSSLAQLERLELLNLGGNKFEGTIPDFLGTMPRLQFIVTYDSGLDGPIPETFCSKNRTGLAAKIAVDCSTTKECSCCSKDPRDNAMVTLLCADLIPELLLDNGY